jgi:predicted transcriptional regulator
MNDDQIMVTLRSLGKKRRRLVKDTETCRQEIHRAAIEAAAAGWNNQQIAEEVGVTREIIRRHVGPVKAERGEQERS